MNEVLKIAEMSDELIELREKVRLDNPNENPLVDTYNQGIDAMYNQAQSYLNKLALKKAFGGEKNG